MPATPANTITPRREIKNYQVSGLINLTYVALGWGGAPVECVFAFEVDSVSGTITRLRGYYEPPEL